MKNHIHINLSFPNENESVIDVYDENGDHIFNYGVDRTDPDDIDADLELAINIKDFTVTEARLGSKE